MEHHVIPGKRRDQAFVAQEQYRDSEEGRGPPVIKVSLSCVQGRDKQERPKGRSRGESGWLFRGWDQGETKALGQYRRQEQEQCVHFFYKTFTLHVLSQQHTLTERVSRPRTPGSREEEAPTRPSAEPRRRGGSVGQKQEPRWERPRKRQKEREGLGARVTSVLVSL